MRKSQLSRTNYERWHDVQACFRFLRDCPECFWAFQEGHRWERAVSVKAKRREEICLKWGLKFKDVPDMYEGERIIGLGEPPMATCKAVLAQGGGKCWVSSLFFLLTGRKSGKTTSHEKFVLVMTS